MIVWVTANLLLFFSFFEKEQKVFFDVQLLLASESLLSWMTILTSTLNLIEKNTNVRIKQGEAVGRTS